MAFPTGWAWQAAITIPAAKIVGTHANFPVLLTEVNFPTAMMDGGADSALNGGGDVRFSEDAAGTVQLPCEIVSFVTGGAPLAEVWVKFPTLNSGSDKTIYVWYKNAGQTQPLVTDSFGRNAVWADYIAVYHLKETTGTNFINAAGNSTFDLTSSATSTNISGKTGGGINFNAAYPQVVAGVVTAYPFSVTCWGRQNTLDAFATLVSGSRNNANSRFWNLRVGNAGSGYRIESQSVTGGTTGLASSTMGITAGAWFHAAGVWAGDTDRRAFLNGGSKGTNANSVLMPTSQALFKLGAVLSTGAEPNPNGDIDEARIYNGTLADSWITTEYNNQSSPSAFATAGTPVAVGSGVTLSPNSGASSQAAGSVALSQSQSLMVQGASHSQTADNVTLSQGSTLVVQNAAHALASDTGAIAQAQVMTVAGAVHAAMSDSPALSQFQTLTANDTAHSQTSDAVILAQFEALTAASATHGLISDSPALSQGQGIFPADSAHNVSSDNVTLTQIQALVVQNATHGLDSGNVTFNPVAIQPSADRTLTLQAEDRTLMIDRESRTYAAPAETRILRI